LIKARPVPAGGWSRAGRLHYNGSRQAKASAEMRWPCALMTGDTPVQGRAARDICDTPSQVRQHVASGIPGFLREIIVNGFLSWCVKA